MTLSIFAAILLAALLHALWNALAKRQAEGRVSVLLVSLCSGLFSLPFLPLVGWPAPVEYPWLALSILFANSTSKCDTRLCRLTVLFEYLDRLPESETFPRS